MKYRIAAWALVGFVVAGCWAIYAFTRPVPITGADPMVWTLAEFTQPIVPVSFYFHFGLHYTWALAANAATYALAGLIVEALRRKPQLAT